MEPRKNSANMSVSVSIASIQVKSLAGQKKEAKIYGEVMIGGCDGLHFLYRRNRRSPETKAPGDFLALTGPSSPVRCPTETLVYFSLYDEDDDHEIAIGELFAYFLGWSHVRSNFNRPLIINIDGKYGSVEVTYSTIDYAMHAAIKVVLIRRRAGGGEDGDLAEVYGKVVASQYFGEVDQRTRMKLFDRSLEEGARVSPGEQLPLIRSLVEAPASYSGSCLTLEIDLWMGEYRIAEGSFDYYVEPSGVYDPSTPFTKSFAGAGGEVRVSINSVGR